MSGRRQHHRHVLGAVHRDIDPAVEQRVLDLACTNSRLPPASRRAARSLQPIARRRMTTISRRGSPIAPRARAATSSACHSASGCRACRCERPSARVALTITPSSSARPRSAARAGAGSGVVLVVVAGRDPGRARTGGSGRRRTSSAAPRDRRSAFELLGRRDQQLLDDQPRDLVDAGPRLGRQRRRSSAAGDRARRWRIASKRWRSATTVGIAVRERAQVMKLSTSSLTMASARVVSPLRRARFSLTIDCRSSML